MFKYIVVLAMAICVASAGLIGGHVATVAVAHGASSYQNHNSLSVHPVPVAVAHAPVAVAHAPIIAHAPIAVAHAPVAIGLGHGWH